MPELAVCIIYIFIFLYGIVIGSFLNVCIYRLPKRESIVPGSHCMSCGHRLRWYDLFPVFSYILLGGRCRYCKEKVSVQYPLIEALNGILYIIIFMANGFCFQSVILCLMTSALVVICLIDERTYEIPLPCNIFIGILGVVWTIADYQNLSLHLIGLVCVSLPLYILYFVSGGRAIGGGDIKLMAAAGLLTGWKNVLLGFFLACIIGAFCHIIRMKLTKAEHVLAMGPYLSIAVFITSLWGEQMIGWYLGCLGV